MTNKRYSFRSNWRIDAPLETVWQVLTAVPFSWSDWWPELRDVHNIKITPNLEGTTFRCSWQAPVGYRLKTNIKITRITPLQEVELQATGDLVGTVTCCIREHDNKTKLAIDWHVQTTKAWMNWFTLLLRPVFIWSHHRVMKSGERGLQQYVHKNPA